MQPSTQYANEFRSQGHSHLASELLAWYKSTVVDKYPQYRRNLEGNIRVVKAKRNKSSKGGLWFSKGQTFLAFGNIQYREDIGKPQYFITIISPIDGVGHCLCPINILETVELVK